MDETKAYIDRRFSIPSTLPVFILVFTCDKYSDTPAAFEYLWRRSWPNCPYPMSFITNSKPIRQLANSSARVFYYPHLDQSYAFRLRRYIREQVIPADAILLLMMADYFVRRIDVGLIEKSIHSMRRDRSIGHIRLRPLPPPVEPGADFGRIEKGARYSLSLQPGLWRSSLLYFLCRDEETAHQTEIQGSKRMSSVRQKVLSVVRPAIIHYNYYRHGAANPNVVEWVRDMVTREAWPDAAVALNKEKREKGEKK